MRRGPTSHPLYSLGPSWICQLETLRRFYPRIKIGIKSANRTMRINLVHIPKTSGTSLRKDLERHGFSVNSREECFESFQKLLDKQGECVVSMFRLPINHVKSQFRECKYDPWGKIVTRNTTFPRDFDDWKGFDIWIRYFGTELRYGGPSAFNCYSPYNMQARYMTCRHLNAHFIFTEKHAHPSVTEAIQRMKMLDSVGITEHYRLSLCNIIYSCSGHLPDQCQCWRDMEETHDRRWAPKETFQPLIRSSQVTHRVTEVDKKLYHRALFEFWSHIRAIERKENRTLTCHHV